MVQPRIQAVYYKQPGYEARDCLALIDYIDIRVYYFTIYASTKSPVNTVISRCKWNSAKASWLL